MPLTLARRAPSREPAAPTCVRRLARPRPPHLTDGSQLRDFIPLSDVARAVEHCLGLLDWGDGLFNVGTGRNMSVLELAQLIAETYTACRGKHVPVECGSKAPGGPTLPFEFAIEKLLGAGFVLRGQIAEEVAGTFKLIEQEVATGAG